MHVVAVVLAMLVSSTALAERWYIMSSGTFGAQTAVDLDSIAPLPGYPGSISVLVYVHNGINTFGCSPPLNCIATSQLTYYYVDCRSLQAAEIRRVPMDLREKVVAVVEPVQVTWFPLIRRYIDRDADRENGSRVRAEIDERHRELLGFCGLYNAGKLGATLTTDGRR